MMKLFVGIILALLLACSGAEATPCFWVNGTGTWNTSNTASWASSTGGTPGTCGATGGIPKQSADTATFDVNSGGGTVTVNATFSISSITMGAFTGTLDFSANNNSITLQSFSNSGTGVRTLNMGSGTWTINSNSGTPWNFNPTNLTFNAGTSTIALTPNANSNNNFAGGGETYSTISVTTGTGSSLTFTGANTIGTLNLIVTAPMTFVFPGGSTTTITNAFTWTGTSSNQIGAMSGTAGTTATVSVASGSPTMAWAAVRDLTFTGGATFTATNSFNLGHNSGITITAPSGGGGGGGFAGIIGGM